MPIRDKLVERRTQLGISPSELARRAKLNQATIWQIEAGTTKNPGMGTVKKLAKGLGCQVNDLIDEGPLKHTTESDLLSAFGRLTPEHKKAVLAMANALLNGKK